jgi:hypothetical protein
MVEVTQEDREATNLLADAILCHPDIVAAAFAHHRTAALAAKEAENAELRAKVEKMGEFVMEAIVMLDNANSPTDEARHDYVLRAGGFVRATLAETQP